MSPRTRPCVTHLRALQTGCWDSGRGSLGAGLPHSLRWFVGAQGGERRSREFAEWLKKKRVEAVLVVAVRVSGAGVIPLSTRRASSSPRRTLSAG